MQHYIPQPNGVYPMATNPRQEHDTIQRLFQEGVANPDQTIIVTVDIEAYDAVTNPVRIQALGLSLRTVDGDESTIRNHYFRIFKNRPFVNRYCPSNPQGFAHGTTEEIYKAGDLAIRLGVMFWALQRCYRTVVLAGYGTPIDLGFLLHGISFLPPMGLVIIDVQLALMHKHGLGLNQKPRL
ncbi:hypothetical protein VP1G_05179 [Cytospora mali]|uniref:Uncharacterized protein n=1 Tax=Cytospora mali TaxID=578113 RepID=A0A194V1Y9_CYTMA|nr:hypothetical protein VP1G_05179 [Valsa mali var. pyri (nom. inval.)]